MPGMALTYAGFIDTVADARARAAPGVSGRRAGAGGGGGTPAVPLHPAWWSRRGARTVPTARRRRYSWSGVGSAVPGTGKRRLATARARAWPPRRS